MRTIDDAEEFYTSGACGIFAYALWIVLGRPKDGMIGIISCDDGEPFSDDIPFDATHAYLDLPNCEMDVYGCRSSDDMAEEFDLDGWSYCGPYPAEEFRRLFLSEDDSDYAPLLGGEARIQEAIAFIEANRERYVPA